MARDVLVVGFNRPDLVESQLAKLTQVDFERLFICIDGPRQDRRDDREKILAIRKGVDTWRKRMSGTVVTRFRESNVGAKFGVAEAITWAFETAEELIILEDDCGPAVDFFTFATEMLNRWRNEPRVMGIGGFNHLPDKLRQKIVADYFFSRHAQIWGWATWRDRWQQFSRVRAATDVVEIVNAAFSDRKERGRWLKVLQGKFPKALSWDSYWYVACRLNQGYFVSPRENLISNMGMRGDASHLVHVDPVYIVPTGQLPGPYKATGVLAPVEDIEQWIWKVALSMGFWDRCMRFFRTRILGRFFKREYNEA